MEFGICPLSVVPVRSNLSDKAEMVTQLLFGETVEVLEKKGAWLKIRCTWDNYIGWVDKKQLERITPSEWEHIERHHAYCLELIQPANADDFFLTIGIGARLPDFDGIRFRLHNKAFTFSGQAAFPSDIRPSAELIVKLARKYLHAPYLWGGRSPLGIDCSGFSQTVFKMAGIKLPRDAYQQVECGELVDFAEQARAGDLAFFENSKGRIVHVGILLSENEIIHAHGKVRIDKIDHYGIFNTDTRRYSHYLRVIKRVLPEALTPRAKVNQEKTVDTSQVELF